MSVAPASPRSGMASHGRQGNRASNAPILNLALQGGGAHGAFGWGVLDMLLEDGRIDIDGLSATSAGAMNAVVYAYGKMKGGKAHARECLETFWRKISRAGDSASPYQKTPLDWWLQGFGIKEPMSYRLFETMTRTFSPYQFNPLNLNPLRDVLTSVVDFDELKACRCTRIRLCATNVKTGKPQIFTNEMMSPEIVQASACLPMLFQAVEVDGQHYWDGGYVGNPAIYPLIYDAEAQDILIVHINPIVRAEVPRGPTEIFNRINEISFNSSLIREMRAIAFATKLIDEDWIRPEYRDRLKRIFIHAIRSDDVMAEFSVASKFDTSWPFLTRLRDLGRAAASAWLDAHVDDLGRRSTVDLHHEYL
jgi:NTE family protein